MPSVVSSSSVELNQGRGGIAFVAGCAGGSTRSVTEKSGAGQKRTDCSKLDVTRVRPSDAKSRPERIDLCAGRLTTAARGQIP